MKKEGIRVLYSDINSFKLPNETIQKAPKWLAQPLMGVTKENIQHSLIQQFFTELPVNPETEDHLEFLYHVYSDPEPWKRTAPYPRLLHLFISSSITLSIHSSIIHPSL